MADKNKPDNLLTTLAAVGRMALLLIGLVGIAVEFFRDDGILKQMISKLFNSSVWYIYIIVGAAVLYFLNKWMATSDGKASSGKGDLPLYIMMAIGAFFVFRFITTGSL
jgi:hypothetical protein